ncbi:hypothetical protein M422DRAFT_247239 [Sphaerobolus stellatus SS14]|nr:hypothetical protein M422DRAFT_247239 [Sphaerobolus stellatus SS14]
MAKLTTLLLLAAIRLAMALAANESLVGLSDKKIISPWNGVTRPDQLVTVVMEGLDLANDFAKFLVYQAQHGTFEGNAGMTRVAAFFGDQVVINETLFQEAHKKRAIVKLFNVTYDINASAELRNQRLQSSIKTNPKLVYASLRILSAYSEAVFLTIFFVDGRLNNSQLTIDAARHFFDLQHMPDDFHRQPAPENFSIIEPLVREIFNKHSFIQGISHGKNIFVLLPNTPGLSEFCGKYEDIEVRVVPGQYPRPNGALKTVLNKSVDFLFDAFSDEHNCTQFFRYGWD